MRKLSNMRLVHVVGLDRQVVNEELGPDLHGVYADTCVYSVY